MKKYKIYQNIKAEDTDPAQESYDEEYRSPININTASLPVLVASLSNLKKGTGEDAVEITLENAQALAANIIAHAETFTDWNSFNDFLLQQTAENRAFYNDPDASTKIAIIRANADPNVILNRSNPDAPLYSSVNKLELTTHTNEFCFYPLGNFEAF